MTRGANETGWQPWASDAATVVAVSLVVWLAFAVTLFAPGLTPWTFEEPPRAAQGVAAALTLGVLVLSVPITLVAAHLPGRRGTRSRPALAAAAVAGEEDSPGRQVWETVSFRTEGARRRFIAVGSASSGLEFSMPSGRLGNHASATVSLGALPETVTCGTGYLEVLWFTGDGIVFNEVRTHGDVVTVTALPWIAPSAEDVVSGWIPMARWG